MLARWTADLVVLIHALFVVFVVLGGLLALYRRCFLWLHPPAAIWGFLIEVRGWICPLTYLENHLRRLAGQAGYSGGFVEHYVIPVLYPQDLTRNIQYLLATLVVVVNLAIYSVVIWRLRGGRSS